MITAKRIRIVAKSIHFTQVHSHRADQFRYRTVIIVKSSPLAIYSSACYYHLLLQLYIEFWFLQPGHYNLRKCNVYSCTNVPLSAYCSMSRPFQSGFVSMWKRFFFRFLLQRFAVSTNATTYKMVRCDVLMMTMMVWFEACPWTLPGVVFDHITNASKNRSGMKCIRSIL